MLIIKAGGLCIGAIHHVLNQNTLAVVTNGVSNSYILFIHNNIRSIVIKYLSVTLILDRNNTLTHTDRHTHPQTHTQ